MRRRFLLIAVLVVGIVPSLALAASAKMHPHLTASLSGSVEVPKGADNGKGNATFDLNGGKGKVCWKFSALSGLEGKPLLAHIHKGGPGKAGPVVVPLGPQGKYSASGCVSASKTVIEAIESNPGAYYVNIHNNKYPAGAIRGQLKAGPA